MTNSYKLMDLVKFQRYKEVADCKLIKSNQYGITLVEFHARRNKAISW